jgi:hypothetical protein
MPKKNKKKKQQHDEDELIYRNIKKVKDAEWEEFEEFYVEAVQDIVVPADLDASDILLINSQIDEVYSLARFDYGYAKKMSQRYTQRLSNAKRQMKLVFKKQKGQTNEDRDALIIQFLDTMPLEGDDEPLFTLVERWQEREIFMEGVIDNLLKKSDKMVNGNGALKLDAQGRGEYGKGGRKYE